MGDDELRAAMRGQDGWRWWVKLAAVTLASLGAAAVITFGAWRYLVLADQQRDQVECIRAQVQAQASSTSGMASAVLDLRLSVEQRRAAVVTWSEQQARVAEAIGRC